MSTKVIPMSRFEATAAATLVASADSGEAIVVELADGRLMAIQPLDPTDDDDTLVSDLIEHNPAFRALVARAKAEPRRPFAAEDEV